MREIKLKNESEISNISESFRFQDTDSDNKKSKPIIAGVLLILAGSIALLIWIPAILIDVSMLESLIDISQFQDIDPRITIETLKDTIMLCATLAIILSLFPILGGIVSIKRKMWGVAVACSIIGLFTIGIIFLSSIFSLVALIIIILSRNDFH